MKAIRNLDLGFRDAENYRRREYHELFSRVFLRTPELDRLCEGSTVFLVGEKGTGKTAYAVYMSNSEYKGIAANLKYIRETEYQKFVAMKQQRQLQLTEYTRVWKVILYLLLAEQVRAKEGQSLLARGVSKFSKLSEAVGEFYRHAFAPEIANAMVFAEQAGASARLVARFLDAGIEGRTSVASTASQFQINLMYLERSFEDALRSLKLKFDYVLFIDGVDTRPQSVDYETYLDCIKGLANAVWSANNDFFPTIRDSKGRLRVVLLTRPDIFSVLGLQNQNSKIRDNAVILNWSTTYADVRSSSLFQMANQLLSQQQEPECQGPTVWDHYFPYDTPNLRSRLQSPSSFVSFLRYSLQRPRDILTMLAIHKEDFLESGRDETDVFRVSDFENPAFTRKYSDYMLGEIREHVLFYYDESDYQRLVEFFQYLNGQTRFTYDEYLNAFQRHGQFMSRNRIKVPRFCETPDTFLQFLYDLNILCYMENMRDESHFGWCYRERSPSNIAPRVKPGVRYMVHYGLMKALDLGKRSIR